MQNYAHMIDHTNLSTQCTSNDIVRLCAEAVEYQFKSVCVAPHFVATAKKHLEGSDVLVCTVVGFPLGYSTTAIKSAETTEALKNGADEIDMVINNCLLKEQLYKQLTADMAAVVRAAEGKTVKVILETCLLEESQIVKACQCAIQAGVHFVKTSTGFSTSGATIESVKLMKQIITANMQVKASGGIRDFDQAHAMVQAGATRLGTSASVAIVSGTVKKNLDGGY